jgi:Flp pilus assembly pilin Flp
MPSRAASTVSVRHVWRRFRRNGRGSAAVELALVAPVFFALLFAIIETGVMFFASQQLETITQESARMILTGQAQTASYTQAQFQNYVCSQIPVPALFACGNIFVDVESYPSATGSSCCTFQRGHQQPDRQQGPFHLSDDKSAPRQLSNVVTAANTAGKHCIAQIKLHRSNQKAALTARPFLVDTYGISKVSAFASRTERDSLSQRRADCRPKTCQSGDLQRFRS